MTQTMDDDVKRPDAAEIASIEATLKPCPHCGPMPAMPELVRNDTSTRWQVFCGPCGSSSGSSKEPRDAADHWNSRHVSGPELATTGAALTRLALLLGNGLKDLTPSEVPPVYGFATKQRQARAYELAREIVDMLNWAREQARETENDIATR